MTIDEAVQQIEATMNSDMLEENKRCEVKAILLSVYNTAVRENQ